MELLEEILNPENLNKAYKRVYQNRGASGVDGVTVEEIADYIKDNKERIINQIRKRRYKPQPVRRVQIPKEKKSRNTNSNGQNNTTSNISSNKSNIWGTI